MKYYQRNPLRKTNAFVHAAHGLWYALKNELNFKIHVAATITVIITGLWLSINTIEWLWVVGCCALVLSMELFNTAIEVLCNRITKEYDADIKIIKDTSAAAVLVCSIGSAIIGGIIFLPKILNGLKTTL